MTTPQLTIAPDPELLSAVLLRESARLAQTLAAASTLDRQVPGLNWTAGQVASHLGVVYTAFAAVMRDENGPVGAGSAAGAELRDTVAAMNEVAVAEFAFATPAEAAAVLTTGAQDLTGALGAIAGELTAHRPTPWYGPDATMPVGNLAALAVTETLVHGYDIHRALGVPARLAPDAAAAAAPTIMSTMLPLLVDPAAVGERRLAFEVRVRGGRPFVLRIAEGRAQAEAVRAGGGPVDCVVSMTGESALLTGFARRPLWRSVATGAAFSWGRRPWLGLAFPGLFLKV